jgi:ubiquitin C-terminal hydrolase
MKKYKVNDYCSFPFDLNMKKYTSEFLNESKNFYPDSYYDFKLRGVIVHYGTSEAGHYYSYIKDK